ncbi:MAG: hypothetical protein DCC49_08510 [Acidobacteria bacterium]|nr:MAG: hypothetical protein DCC49_08510 [Acidobacteriota bacterium]
MPLYAYKCNSCGHDFDARNGFDDRDDANCPECGDAARRLISTVAVTGVKGPSSEPFGGCSPDMCAMRQEAGMPCSMNA